MGWESLCVGPWSMGAAPARTAPLEARALEPQPSRLVLARGALALNGYGYSPRDPMRPALWAFRCWSLEGPVRVGQTLP